MDLGFFMVQQADLYFQKNTKNEKINYFLKRTGEFRLKFSIQVLDFVT